MWFADQPLVGGALKGSDGERLELRAADEAAPGRFPRAPSELAGRHAAAEIFREQFRQYAPGAEAAEPDREKDDRRRNDDQPEDDADRRASLHEPGSRHSEKSTLAPTARRVVIQINSGMSLRLASPWSPFPAQSARDVYPRRCSVSELRDGVGGVRRHARRASGHIENPVSTGRIKGDASPTSY